MYKVKIGDTIKVKGNDHKHKVMRYKHLIDDDDEFFDLVCSVDDPLKDGVNVLVSMMDVEGVYFDGNLKKFETHYISGYCFFEIDDLVVLRNGNLSTVKEVLISRETKMATLYKQIYAGFEMFDDFYKDYFCKDYQDLVMNQRSVLVRVEKAVAVRGVYFKDPSKDFAYRYGKVLLIDGANADLFGVTIKLKLEVNIPDIFTGSDTIYVNMDNICGLMVPCYSYDDEHLTIRHYDLPMDENNDERGNTYCETPRCDLLLDIFESVLSRAIKESSTKPIDNYFENSVIETVQQVTFVSDVIHNIRKFIDTGSVPALREVLYAVSKNEAGVFEWRNVFDMCVILGSEVQKLLDAGLFEPFENKADVEHVTVTMVDNFFTFLSSPDEEDLGVEFVMCLIRLLKLCELYPGANTYEKRFNNGNK